MNIFGAIPKKTALLVVVLIIALVTLLYFLFFNQNNGSDNTKTDTALPTKTSPINQAKTSIEIPSFNQSSTPTTKSTYDIRFATPEGFTLPPTVDNVKIVRAVDDALVSHLLSRLKITSAPTNIGTLTVWQSTDKAKALQIEPSSGYIQYSGKESTPKADSSDVMEKLSSDEAVASIEGFITSLNIAKISPKTAEISMFARSPHGDKIPTVDPSQAYLYEISYSQSYRGIPIYYQFSTPAKITTLIDIFGKIRSIQFFNIQPTQTTGTTKLDLEDIKRRVSAGNYTVVKIEGEKPPPLTGTITITKTSLVYFDDKKSSTFFPVILLVGKVQPSERDVFLYHSVFNNN